MLNQEYDTMRQVEDTYWWYQVLHGHVANQVGSLVPGDEGAILDAGCGTGGTLRHLQAKNPAWNLHGFDFSPLAVDHCRSRGFDQIQQGSVDDIASGSSFFDVVVSLDVLCHSGLDEEKAVAEFARVTKTGGHVIMNLPAFNFLMGRHDVAVGSVRRYTAGRVREMLAAHGLQVKELHFWNAWLFAPILAWRQLSRLQAPKYVEGEAKSDLTALPGPLNKALAAVARVDMSICRRLKTPFGTSLFVVACKS